MKLTVKNYIGLFMLLMLFAGMFAGMAYKSGIENALIALTIPLGLLGFCAVAIHLMFDEPKDDV